MTASVIRPLRSSEIPLLAWSGSPTHLRYVEAAVERSHRAEVDFLAIWVGDEPVGIGGLDYTADSQAGKLWMLAVHPEHQSQGLGSLLMQALEQRAKARGRLFTQLSVETKNSRAIELYVRLGYEVVGECEESWEHETDSGQVNTYFATCYVMRKEL